MDPGPPDSKRPRLSTGTSSWSAGTAHGLSLPPVTPQPPHHPASGPYQHQPYPPRTSEPLPPHPHPAQHHPDDRRHHDQEPYTPMQDQYRPPHSPAHHHFNHHYPPPRDAVIKRELPDDSLPQHRRPHSNGGPPDGLGPPHSAPPPPPPPPSQSYPEDPRRQMSYDNGPPVPPSSGPYRHPGFPAPPPTSHPPPYDHQPYSQPSAPDFGNIPYTTASSKRKPSRASQACDSCRQLKAKCDEAKPCKGCRDKGVECKYRETVPKATDKTQSDILDGIGDLKKLLADHSRRFMMLEDALHRIQPGIKLELDGEMERISEPAATIGPAEEEGYDSPSIAQETPRDHPQEHLHEHSLAVGDTHLSAQMMVDDEENEDRGPPGPPVLPGEPSIPVNHTTLAGLLLTWPSIRDMTQHLLEHEKIKYVEEFHLEREQSRGLLRVYGRGEGRDRSIDRESAAVEYGTIDMGEDAWSDVGSSPTPQEAWGQLGGLSPPNHVEYKSSTLTADGHPDFSEAKVRLYVKSFEENMLIMHPILMPKDMHILVRRFLDNLAYSERKAAKASAPSIPGVAKFVSPTQPQSSPDITGKRKRSPVASDIPEPAAAPIPQKPGKPCRTIENALVLVILALGKICLHRDKLPDVPRDNEPPSYQSPSTRNGHPSSPSQTSPPSYPQHVHSSGLPSPKEQNTSLPMSRRHSFQGGPGSKTGQSMKRNYDVIPGLEYFAYATDILGNQMAGTSLRHVHANIFAGLYHGQLGRVMESYGYIANACRTLQIIMRRDLDRFQKLSQNHEMPEKRRENQVMLAYWTCLQLESDILAELNLPQSGLLALEQLMPWPNLKLMENEGFDRIVVDSYAAQLYLRKHLNIIHSMFYDPKKAQAPEGAINNVRDVEAQVNNMMWVGETLKFREDDPPADEILAARLRAKYWGAQVITYRPFIKMILEFSHKLKTNSSSEMAMMTTEELGNFRGFKPHITAPFIHPETKTHDAIDPEVIEFAKKGIRALEESTKAFHGVDDKRVIITNVFGTAHAQWGNLLVLAAALLDPVLRQHVNSRTIQNLFQRTILFFNKTAQPSSALASDMRILEHLERDLFGMDSRANSSFSSSASMTGPMHPTAQPVQPPMPYPGGEMLHAPPPPMHR